MPDAWEMIVGLDPSDPADAMEDFDSDGLINLQEFIHDTDPFDTDTDGDGVEDGGNAERYDCVRFRHTPESMFHSRDRNGR
jgi:hypothetical protein